MSDALLTPPYETVESLRARLGGMYGKAEVGNVKSIAWFVAARNRMGGDGVFWDRVACVYDVFANVINRKANRRSAPR